MFFVKSILIRLFVFYLLLDIILMHQNKLRWFNIASGKIILSIRNELKSIFISHKLNAIKHSSNLPQKCFENEKLKLTFYIFWNKKVSGFFKYYCIIWIRPKLMLMFAPFKFDNCIFGLTSNGVSLGFFFFFGLLLFVSQRSRV